MKTAVVTGGAGFIGSALARALSNGGWSVHAIDDLSTGFERNIPEGVRLHRADISDAAALTALPLPKTADAMFHLAAQSSGEASFDDPSRDAAVNYGGTLNALSLARGLSCERFLFASSMSVYGPVPEGRGPVGEDFPCAPASYYGVNKLASEHAIRVFSGTTGMKATSLRLFSVYGPGQNMRNLKQGIVSIYLSYLVENRPILVKGSLDRFRDLTFVDDVVDAFVRSVDSPESFDRTLNVGTGVKTTVRDLLEASLRAFGKEGFERWVEVAGRTPGDTLGCVADVSRIKGALGWEAAHTIGRGLEKMKSWLDETAALWRTA